MVAGTRGTAFAIQVSRMPVVQAYPPAQLERCPVKVVVLRVDECGSRAVEECGSAVWESLA